MRSNAIYQQVARLLLLMSYGYLWVSSSFREVASFCVPTTSSRTSRVRISTTSGTDAKRGAFYRRGISISAKGSQSHSNYDDVYNDERTLESELTPTSTSSRRSFLSSIVMATAATSTLGVQPSNAGEVGARINRAVTQSDLGISVRRSVVRGAQMMDKLDGDWEKFSGEYSVLHCETMSMFIPLPMMWYLFTYLLTMV